MTIEITHRSTVQAWECDHMGHMNVRHYMAKFDDAAWTFLSMLGITNRYFEDHNAGVAAIDHQVSYMRELMPGDSVIIHTQLALLEGKKFKMIHKMSDAVSGDEVASCELFGVHMDRSVRRAANFPEEILQKAQAFLADTQKAAE